MLFSGLGYGEQSLYHAHAGIALGAKGGFPPDDTGPERLFGDVVGGLYPLVIEVGPEAFPLAHEGEADALEFFIPRVVALAEEIGEASLDKRARRVGAR